ncbi:MAG: triose-phosphate isomerase [Lentisphaeria bacterium]|nr:triose-phosphate isomerase [Lentisphaeria bacterium]
MGRKVIIAGNWKMNKNAAEGAALVEELKHICADSGCSCCGEVDVVVCPPFTTIAAVVEAAKGTPIKVGAQNIHWADNGAFTGEISGDMLKTSGVEYVIIGHSERRQYFGETDATVNARLKAALKYGLKPIVCVGELLAEREANRTEAVLSTQIRGGFAGITGEEMAGIVVAYEPVWAIGTGKTATPEIAEAAHAHIRGELAAMFGTEVAEKVRIQYGGSMKSANARELVAQKDIDGGLIGGAALKAGEFAALIREALGK